MHEGWGRRCFLLLPTLLESQHVQGYSTRSQMEKAWKDSRQVPLTGLQGWPQRLPCKIRGTVGSAKHLLRLRARQQGLHEGRAGCVLSLSV